MFSHGRHVVILHSTKMGLVKYCTFFQGILYIFQDLELSGASSYHTSQVRAAKMFLLKIVGY
jgi:hypothetical protein